MKIRLIIAFAAFASVVGVVFSSNLQRAETAGAESAKCKIASFDEAYTYAKAVFVGEVVGEVKNGDVRFLDFKVEKYWKGAEKKKIEIQIYETTRYQSWFKKGEKYLVYAAANSDGSLRVGRCSRSRDLESAEEDLQKLGKGKTPR